MRYFSVLSRIGDALVSTHLEAVAQRLHAPLEVCFWRDHGDHRVGIMVDYFDVLRALCTGG